LNESISLGWAALEMQGQHQLPLLQHQGRKKLPVALEARLSSAKFLIDLVVEERASRAERVAQ